MYMEIKYLVFPFFIFYTILTFTNHSSFYFYENYYIISLQKNYGIYHASSKYKTESDKAFNTNISYTYLTITYIYKTLFTPQKLTSWYTCIHLHQVLFTYNRQDTRPANDYLNLHAVYYRIALSR